MYRDIIDDIGNVRSACVMDYNLLEYHNGRVIPLQDRIKALEDAGAAVAGKDGRDLELRKGLFPDDPSTQDLPENYAIMWRLKARTGEVEQPWTLLIYLAEIKGEQGDEGPQGEVGPTGPAGKGIAISGFVGSTSELTSLTGVSVGDIYMNRVTQELFILQALPSSASGNWSSLGNIAGIAGPVGPQGPQGVRGPKGPKGADGSVSSILISWIVDTATNQAINSVTLGINDAINDAINTLTNQLMGIAEDAASSALSKALDDMVDTFKGDKGEKGDKGDKGKDGKDGQAFVIEETFDGSLPPHLPDASLKGKGYIRSKDGHLFVCVDSLGTGIWVWKDMGLIRGPQGERGQDANWSIQLRDEDNVAIGDAMEIPTEDSGVPNMYIRGYDGIVVEKFQGTNTGFSIKSKLPIPQPVPNNTVLPTTVGKVLSNDGIRLKWIDPDTFKETVTAIRMQSENGYLFDLTVTDDGRLEVQEVRP